MKSRLFLLILYGLTLEACFGEEMKKDQFPCMAFLYYHDTSIKNPLYEDKRFLQNAILIKPDFLLTASISDAPLLNNKYHGYPHKTLLARIGAVTIDETLQYNEDENEQEREIVQVIRPYHYNHHVWWKSDISVLKSVTSFNVKSITFPVLYGSTEQDCTTLSYVKSNVTMERTLRRYDFRVLPASQCGTEFSEATMICGEYPYGSPPPDFCEGNAGGPLLCSDHLVGLQTFIKDECKPPYLFQSLSKWEKFITCSISQSCHEEECSTICSVNLKDVVDSKENQMMPKEGEEVKETLKVLPAEVTESLSNETEVTRTSAQPKYIFNSTSIAPTMAITSDKFRKNYDSSESLDKTKESGDGSGDSGSIKLSTKSIEMVVNKANSDISLDMSNTDEINESLDRRFDVSGDKSISNSGDKSNIVSGDKSNYASGDKSNDVSGDKSNDVKGYKSYDVSGDKSNDVSGYKSYDISGDKSIAVSGDKSNDVNAQDINKIDNTDEIVERRNENVLKSDEKNETSEEKSNEKDEKSDEDTDESEESNKSDDLTATTYASVSKGLSKITLEDLYKIGPSLQATKVPTTKAPTTKGSATEAPNTEAPTTEAPTTEAPTTEAPTTEASDTEAPDTEARDSEASDPEAPDTKAPATEAPAPKAISTKAPAPKAISTKAPTTKAQTTKAQTTKAPITKAPTTKALTATLINPDKALRKGEVNSPEKDQSDSGLSTSDEKTNESIDRRFDASDDNSNDASGDKSNSVSGEKSQESSEETNAKRSFDSNVASGASVISVEISENKDERRTDGMGGKTKEGSNEKNVVGVESLKSSEKTRNSADGADSKGDITAESTGEKSDEKIENRDDSETVEDLETRRKVVSGRLFPPTITNSPAASTTVQNESRKKTNVSRKLRKSHGTKISYDAGLMALVFLNACFVFILKFNY